MALLSVAATAIGIAIVLLLDWFPSQASTAAADIDTLYDVLLVVSVPIFVLVMAVALYSVWAFRVRPGDDRDGEPIHGNTKLEIIWVTIPFIIVSVLAGYGWIVLDDIEAKKPDTLVVDVTGQQFAWSFEYPDQGGVRSNELVLPKDRPVRFRINTADVLHDFWVPDFRLKSDAVPGITTEIRLTPNRLGSYPVVCAELCGIGHSTMRQTVRVVQPAAFESWVARRQRAAEDGGAGENGGDETAAGRQIFTATGCEACHTLADADATGTVGPDLDDLAASAARFGRQQDQSPQEYVRTAIVEPDAFVVPGFQAGLMPGGYSDQLSDAEIDTLVEYLLGVSEGGAEQ
ncbi:MAG: cytochrome c oxidase subunit II [Thermoleophilaceae bacterium]